MSLIITVIIIIIIIVITRNTLAKQTLSSPCALFHPQPEYPYPLPTHTDTHFIFANRTTLIAISFCHRCLVFPLAPIVSVRNGREVVTQIKLAALQQHKKTTEASLSKCISFTVGCLNLMRTDQKKLTICAENGNSANASSQSQRQQSVFCL